MITEDDHDLALELAARAGRLLMRLRRRLNVQAAPPAVLKAQGDRQSQQLLSRELSRARPDDAVLSEEAPDDRSRLDSERVWIVDPLDGTREFAERNRTDWAVHVALAVDGRPVVGAVALPALGVVLSTRHPPELMGAPDGPARLVVSRTRPPERTRVVAELMGARIVTMGSAGAKAMAVVTGEASAYVHAGGQHEWDSCAPVAVAVAAGCVASRLDGREMRYNRADPWLPDLVVCRPELYPSLMTALGAACDG